MGSLLGDRSSSRRVFARRPVRNGRTPARRLAVSRPRVGDDPRRHRSSIRACASSEIPRAATSLTTRVRTSQVSMTGMSPSLCDRTRALLSRAARRRDLRGRAAPRRAAHGARAPACRAFELQGRWLTEELRAAPLEALPDPSIVTPVAGATSLEPHVGNAASTAAALLVAVGVGGMGVGIRRVGAEQPRTGSRITSGAGAEYASQTIRSARSASTRCEPASCRSFPRPVRRPPSSRRARSTGSAARPAGRSAWIPRLHSSACRPRRFAPTSSTRPSRSATGCSRTSRPSCTASATRSAWS